MKQVYVAAAALLMVLVVVAQQARADQTEETVNEMGQLVRIEAALFQRDFNPILFVKCEELGGKCLHPHHAQSHCKGDQSTDNDGKCVRKGMLCCAPVMTYAYEGPGGLKASMDTDELVIGTDTPDMGQLVRVEAELFQNDSNPMMFVKCEELEGKCLHPHKAKRRCKGNKSTDNDGKCFRKEMLCCARAELFQKDSNTIMFVKCEELGGKCLHPHKAKRRCKGNKSTDNDGKCFGKRMLCCARGPSTEGPDGTDASMTTNESVIGIED